MQSAMLKLIGEGLTYCIRHANNGEVKIGLDAGKRILSEYNADIPVNHGQLLEDCSSVSGNLSKIAEEHFIKAAATDDNSVHVSLMSALGSIQLLDTLIAFIDNHGDRKEKLADTLRTLFELDVFVSNRDVDSLKELDFEHFKYKEFGIGKNLNLQRPHLVAV